MEVIRLFTKQQSNGLPTPSSVLILKQGYGIEGDANAAMGSPRQVLVVDQGSLGVFGLQPGDLYENILVDETVTAWRSGQVIQIGQVLIRLTFPCEPCSYLETLHAGLAKRIKGRRGVLGMVVQGGAIAIGDTVTLTPHNFPGLSENARNRFDEFVARIPPGKVVTTTDLILALGVSRAYYRAIPGLMRKAAMVLPVHRIVAKDGSLFTRYIPDQADRLTAEGVKLVDMKVADRDRWHPANFHPL